MKLILFWSVLGLVVTPSLQIACDPAICNGPNCRCWLAPSPPGNIALDQIPQMVMVTFENNINTGNIDDYQSLFSGTVNPNGCAIKGTFFVEDQDSNYGLVKQLFDDGHEIGVNSINDTIPGTVQEYRQMIKNILSKLESAGIDGKSVNGFRAPMLQCGGDNMLTGTQLLGPADSTCATNARSLQTTMVWPYTYDFDVPTCDIGQIPGRSYPGKWEMYIADLHWNGNPCATPAVCVGVQTKKDAFDLLYTSFRTHYEGKRTPMVVYINPSWAKNNDFKEGTIEFLQYLRAAFADVWIITMKQSLDWIQNPTPLSNISNFQPWKC